MKIVQNTLKIEEKFSDVQKKIKSRPQKSRVGRVSGNETFFFCLYSIYRQGVTNKTAFLLNRFRTCYGNLGCH